MGICVGVQYSVSLSDGHSDQLTSGGMTPMKPRTRQRGRSSGLLSPMGPYSNNALFSPSGATLEALQTVETLEIKITPPPLCQKRFKMQMELLAKEHP